MSKLAGTPPSAAKNILCIDDNRAGLAMRKLMLESEGFSVVTADGPQAAFDALGRRRFDAVVLDYKLGEVNGDQVAERLRARHPALPIVLFSGYPADVPQALLKMVNLVLVKGQPVEALSAALQSLTGIEPQAGARTGLEKALRESRKELSENRQGMRESKPILAPRRSRRSSTPGRDVA